MATYFLDSSAIIKRYLLEQGQSLILALCDPAQGHNLYISQAALVEVVAGICRRARENSITIEDRDRFIETFRQDSLTGYGIRFVTTAMYISAGDLCRSYSLRAYDAVQLACALNLRDETATDNAPSPIFVSADNNLINVASAEGLSVENPNNYP